MDETDFRLLQAMGFAPYLPGVPPADARKPTHLAKRVGLGTKATKERIARMEAEGIIAGYQAFPNLRQIAVAWKSFHFRVPDDRKAAFLAALRRTDGYVGHFEFVGQDVCVDLCWSDAERLGAALGGLQGLAGAAPWEFYENATPAVDRKLTPLDWRIVRALRHDAKRPFEVVAKDLGVTARTVKDRFDRMVGEGSLWVIPVVDFGRIPGFIPFGLLVDADDATASERARRLLLPDALYTWTPPDRHAGSLGAMARARTTGGVEDVRRRLVALPGVSRVTVLVPAGVEASSAWLDTAIEAHLSKTGPRANARDVNPRDVEGVGAKHAQHLR